MKKYKVDFIKIFNYFYMIVIFLIIIITASYLYFDFQEKKLVSDLIKFNSTLTNSFNSVTVNSSNFNFSNFNEFRKIFEKNIPISSSSISSQKETCTHDVCLSDGTYFDYDKSSFSDTCNVNSSLKGDTNSLKSSCIKFTADINGEKLPNKSGKDRYNFYVTQSGVFPEGYSIACDGLDCGKFVLTHKKIFNGIKNCEQYNNTGCYKCKNNYTINSSATCTKNIDKCTLYNELGCISCKNNYYVNKDNTCSVLPEGCLSINNSKCTCKEGYSLNINGQCTKNVKNCISYGENECLVMSYNGIPAYRIGNGHYALKIDKTVSPKDDIINLCPKGTHVPTTDDTFLMKDLSDFNIKDRCFWLWITMDNFGVNEAFRFRAPECSYLPSKSSPTILFCISD